MRLFLASEDFGGHVAELHRLVGDNKKALVIFNAQDYKDEGKRGDVIERKSKLFRENGFEFAELDLRNYFGKEQQLKEYIEEIKPGLVFSIGGNYFILRRAFAQSGLDETLLNDLENDKYVYGGSSAGTMIATPDLRYYDDQKAEDVPSGYRSEPIWEGLGLVDMYISPHQDQNWYKPYIKDRLDKLKRDGKPFITLNDSDVYVVDGEKKEVLR